MISLFGLVFVKVFSTQECGGIDCFGWGGAGEIWCSFVMKVLYFAFRANKYSNFASSEIAGKAYFPNYSHKSC